MKSKSTFQLRKFEGVIVPDFSKLKSFSGLLEIKYVALISLHRLRLRLRLVIGLSSLHVGLGSIGVWTQACLASLDVGRGLTCRIRTRYRMIQLFAYSYYNLIRQYPMIQLSACSYYNVLRLWYVVPYINWNGRVYVSLILKFQNGSPISLECVYGNSSCHPCIHNGLCTGNSSCCKLYCSFMNSLQF